ncbi:MAG: 50S ribosomal protein L3 N(5)-glutamine methyltransferase [Gammaproteobacteria bacterium]|nr:50S ribosomal protein L3 N(5)-glutamine methyltransferase [Gammaproteobacteria bacterium]
MINANDAIEELRTLGDLVRWGASSFNEAGLTFGHGTGNALDEAFLLVRHVLHLPHDIPAYMVGATLTKHERRQIVELLMERITSRKPAPYLIHESWFAGLPFYVDERVLIPRSPIAELIEQGFSPWVDPDNVHTILDLCTGSGCIAIACAAAFPEAHITATDNSLSALEVAAINIEKHGMQKQVELVKSDVFQNVPATQQFDVIVSNPPYVDATDIAALSPEFLHEPAGALAAGRDGLDIVKQILLGAADYLSDQGILVVEVGNSETALLEQFPDVPFIWPDFARGGHGVFILSRQELINYADRFQR